MTHPADDPTDGPRLDALSDHLFSAFPNVYHDGKRTWMVNLWRDGQIVHAEADTLRGAIDEAVRMHADQRRS